MKKLVLSLMLLVSSVTFAQQLESPIFDYDGTLESHQEMLVERLLNNKAKREAILEDLDGAEPNIVEINNIAKRELEVIQNFKTIYVKSYDEYFSKKGLTKEVYEQKSLSKIKKELLAAPMYMEDADNYIEIIKNVLEEQQDVIVEEVSQQEEVL